MALQCPHCHLSLYSALCWLLGEMASTGKALPSTGQAALAAAGLGKNLSLENCFLGGINQPHLVQLSCMIDTRSRSVSDLPTRLLSFFL